MRRTWPCPDPAQTADAHLSVSARAAATGGLPRYPARAPTEREAALFDYIQREVGMAEVEGIEGTGRRQDRQHRRLPPTLRLTPLLNMLGDGSVDTHRDVIRVYYDRWWTQRPPATR